MDLNEHFKMFNFFFHHALSLCLLTKYFFCTEKKDTEYMYHKSWESNSFFSPHVQIHNYTIEYVEKAQHEELKAWKKRKKGNDGDNK